MNITELNITDNQGTNQDTYGYIIPLNTTETFIIDSEETKSGNCGYIISLVICVGIILILIPFCIKIFRYSQGQWHQHHHIGMNLYTEHCANVPENEVYKDDKGTCFIQMPRSSPRLTPKYSRDK